MPASLYWNEIVPPVMHAHDPAWLWFPFWRRRRKAFVGLYWYDVFSMSGCGYLFLPHGHVRYVSLDDAFELAARAGLKNIGCYSNRTGLKMWEHLTIVHEERPDPDPHVRRLEH